MGPIVNSPGYYGNNHQRNIPPKRIIETTIVHRASKYGAIAVNSKIGASAVSTSMNSIAAAEREAIRKCESGGRYAPCKASGWVRNGCIAAVAGQKASRSVLFKATGKPGRAERIAMNRCKASRASDCQVIISEACSVPDGMYK
ncbi:DUF4189 domain-containing protein [Neisseria sp.]|uniref:DUF4189 domain-containing protein n=1 Tax=Neisseria sp. TaxID=192066 RepID=UPI00359F1BCA